MPSNPEQKTVQQVCLKCGAVFLAGPYEVKRGRAKACSMRCANALRRQTPEGWKVRKRQRRRTTERWKDRAREAVHRAIQRGELVPQPCETCGTREQIQAHHDDHNDPLQVRWFCRKHHREIEDEIRAGLTR